MYKLFDRVEANDGYGWSHGHVTGVLGGGRYMMCVKHLKKEIELNLAKLRPPSARPGELVESSQVDTPLNTSTKNMAAMEGENGNGSVEAVKKLDKETTTNQAGTSEKNLETSGNLIKPPTKKKTTYRRKGKQRGKARVVFKEPAASPKAQGANGATVNGSKDGTSVNATNDANPEGGSTKESGVVPKRKRGRPVGSLSGSVIGEATVAQTFIGPTRAKSTRRRCGVFESTMSTLRPRPRKSATGTSTSAKGRQAKKRQAKADDRSRSGAEESGAPVSNEAVPPVSEDDLPLSTWIAEPDRGTAENASNGVAERVEDLPVRQLPFAKTSPVWEAIDSLEVFKRMPQSPHFLPLNSSKENYREGLAVGIMVIFSGLVEKISNFTFDDPASLLEEYLATLEVLKTHGFSVEPIQKRVEGILGIKKRYEEAQAVSRELMKEKEAMAKVRGEIEDIDEKIRRLEEERSAAMAKKMAKDGEIRAMQEKFDAVRAFVDGARGEFLRVSGAPW